MREAQKNQHHPRKRFGQHFLIDDAVLLLMQQAIALQVDDHVIEIGPGQGVLTQQLIHQVSRYEAIEIDRDLIPMLQHRFADHPHFILHAMDVLRVDWVQLARDRLLRVVGNLPYNISTPLLFHLFSVLPVIEDMFFLLQKEVGLRMAAAVGTPHFGRLSVMTQYYCDVELLFEVGPHAFNPPPKVNSVFLKLLPKPKSMRNAIDIALLEKVVTAAFNQRRKTVRNSLQALVTMTLLEQLDIDPQKRAQNITVEEYVMIANALAHEVI